MQSMTKGPGPMNPRGRRIPLSPAIACPWWLLALFVILLLPGTGRAAELVTARYAQPSGQELVVEITIGEPPPPSLIVTLTLPAGVSIVEAQPSTKSFNSGKGEIKWLLTDLKAGALTLRLTLDRPLTRAEVAGEVRFRHPKGGGMTSLPIVPP